MITAYWNKESLCFWFLLVQVLCGNVFGGLKNVFYYFVCMRLVLKVLTLIIIRPQIQH